MTVGAYLLQEQAFPQPGSVQGQISATVYVQKNSGARVLLKSWVYPTAPQDDKLAVSVSGYRGAVVRWLLVVQCSPQPGLRLNQQVRLIVESPSGSSPPQYAAVSVHAKPQWHGHLGCYQGPPGGRGGAPVLEGQSVDLTLPVLEQNTVAQSALEDTPVYLERGVSGNVADVVEVFQAPGSSCPASGFSVPPSRAGANVCFRSQAAAGSIHTAYYFPPSVATVETLERVSLGGDRIDSMVPSGQVSSSEITWQGTAGLSPSLSATSLSAAEGAGKATFFAGVLYGLAAGFIVPFLQGFPGAWREAGRGQSRPGAPEAEPEAAASGAG
jgi:hypothetical protein